MFSRARQPELPSLHSAAVQQLCRDYAAYCRDAATPLCEGQKTLAKKMCGLEALCARILYLLALRFNELSGCAATLRDVPQIATKLQESQLLLQRCDLLAIGHLNLERNAVDLRLLKLERNAVDIRVLLALERGQILFFSCCTCPPRGRGFPR